MAEYEVNGVLLSQNLPQYGRDRATLLRRDGAVFAELVLGVVHLSFSKVVCQHIFSQGSEGSRHFNMLCSGAVCYSAASGNAVASRLVGNSSAPIAKVVLLRHALVVTPHGIPRLLVYP